MTNAETRLAARLLEGVTSGALLTVVLALFALLQLPFISVSSGSTTPTPVIRVGCANVADFSHRDLDQLNLIS
jgi:hypothetical protein